MSSNHGTCKFLAKERIDERHAAAEAHRMAKAAGKGRSTLSLASGPIRLAGRLGRFVIQQLGAAARVAGRASVPEAPFH